MVLAAVQAYSQETSERAYRIRKAQFPQQARETLKPYLEDARRLRYYKEKDQNRVRYLMRFKKDRLVYRAAFLSAGEFQALGVYIQPVDIPDDTWAAIQAYLSRTHTHYNVRRILQQYPRSQFPAEAPALRAAFQNLLLPEIRYHLILEARTTGQRVQLEYLFNAEGEFLEYRESLPANFDRILY